MTDAEFVDQVRRGLVMIMGALAKRYKVAWVDMLPKHVTAPPVYSDTTSTPAPEFRG